MSLKRWILIAAAAMAITVATGSFTNQPTRIPALTPVVAHAQMTDPCVSSLKTNVFLYQTAGQSLLIAGAAGKKIYICSIAVSDTDTVTPNISFIQGTGSACATGFTGLGSLITAKDTAFSIAGNGTQFTVATGQDFCTEAGGSTPTYYGWVTYVQV